MTLRAEAEVPAALVVTTVTDKGRTVVSVSGELDLMSAPKLRQILADLMAADEYTFVIDLSGVQFIDSSGLGVLVWVLKRTRAQDGSLQLVCGTDRILNLFRTTGLTKVFPISATLAEAM